MQKRWLLLSPLMILSACSQTSQYPIFTPQKPEIVFSDWYLRGVFNWWEAQPRYQLSASAKGWYVDVELIADQQPYDFKFSNATWTTEQTCGSSYKGYAVAVNEEVILTCGEYAENLQFTPGKTGTYRFAVEGQRSSGIALTVSKLP